MPAVCQRLTEQQAPARSPSTPKKVKKDAMPFRRVVRVVCRSIFSPARCRYGRGYLLLLTILSFVRPAFISFRPPLCPEGRLGRAADFSATLLSSFRGSSLRLHCRYFSNISSMSIHFHFQPAIRHSSAFFDFRFFRGWLMLHYLPRGCTLTLFSYASDVWQGLLAGFCIFLLQVPLRPS